MAITETIQAKEFTAGAPDITLKGDLRPNQMMAGYLDPMSEKNDMAMEMFGKQLKDLTEDELDILDEEIQRLRSKFMAYGGRAQYGLGSIVKSIGKAVKGAVKGVAKGVKSFAKSDLGKAALLTGLGFGAFGKGPLAFSKFGLPTLEGTSLTSLLPGLSEKGAGTLKAFAIGSLGSVALSAAEAGGLDTSDPNAEVDLESLKGYLRNGYMNLNPIGGKDPELYEQEVESFVQENISEYKADGGRIGYSEGTPSFEEYMRERKGIEQKMNMEQMYKEYLEDMRRKKVREQKTMAATGGRIGYAMGTDDKVMMAAGIEGLPVRQNKAGVKELDLRETGGFIQPVGIKEKADDIPAMLSNNEFVFTADAVRAAGGGDVDKGAQLMYDTMKKLESKVV